MSKTVTTFIEVRFQFEGQHHWPNAPEEVAFLKSPHRHIFHARVRMNVSHSDRDLEFILVKRMLQKVVADWGFDLGTLSCEQMAMQLLFYVADNLLRSSIEVEVSEDGENGAIVRYE